MQELLEKFQAQTVTSPYLFPFLVDEGNKSQCKTIDKKRDKKRLYHNAEAHISYHLRKLGVKIGIKGKLTLYVLLPFLGNGSKRQPDPNLGHQRGIEASFRNHHANLSSLHQKLRSG